MKANGAVIFNGPSELDGAPIVVIATGLAAGSANAKTGAMVQVWILRADQAPQEAAHSGADASICGDCPHRGRIVDGRNVDRTCYVTLFQGPRSVYSAWQRGIYSDAAADPYSAAASLERVRIGEGRMVRLGAYGDPAAVPEHVWDALLHKAAGWTGYTHQWRVADHMQRWCMASVDSEAEHIEAEAAGWRTFRVRTATEQLTQRERVCPASEEAGKLTTCAACQACSGRDGRGHSSIAIIVHGAAAKRFKAA
jgi:hypothetical protein